LQGLYCFLLLWKAAIAFDKPLGISDRAISRIRLVEKESTHTDGVAIVDPNLAFSACVGWVGWMPLCRPSHHITLIELASA